MPKIPLTKGRFAIVDDADFDKLSKFKWHLCRKARHEYAYRRDYSGGGKGKMISMHREILNFPKGVVDHINRNGLDNRRKNLRVVSKTVNGLNCDKKINSKNNYKGVQKSGKRWVARIKIGGVRFTSVSFETEIEAHRAYMFINKIITGGPK